MQTEFPDFEFACRLQRLELLALSSSQLLQHALLCQRQLPKSCVEVVSGVLRRLWEVSTSAVHSEQQRRLSKLVICMAPRLLWPEPAHQSGVRLKPHSRPKLIRRRVDLLLRGQWHTPFENWHTPLLQVIIVLACLVMCPASSVKPVCASLNSRTVLLVSLVVGNRRGDLGRLATIPRLHMRCSISCPRLRQKHFLSFPPYPTTPTCFTTLEG